MKINKVKKKNAIAAAFAEAPSLAEEAEYKKLTIVEELLRYMKSEGMNRSMLAEKMGVVPARITKLLNGTENLTIETLVRAGRAVGADLQQTFVSRGQKGHWIRTTSSGASGDNCIALVFAPRKVEQAPTPNLKTNKPAIQDAEDAA